MLALGFAWPSGSHGRRRLLRPVHRGRARSSRTNHNTAAAKTHGGLLVIGIESSWFIQILRATRSAKAVSDATSKSPHQHVCLGRGTLSGAHAGYQSGTSLRSSGFPLDWLGPSQACSDDPRVSPR